MLHHPLMHYTHSGTTIIITIPPSAPIPACAEIISEADTPPRKRLLLTTPRPECEVGESSIAACCETSQDPTMDHRVWIYSHVDIWRPDVRSRESLEFYSRHHDAQKDRAAVRAEIEALAGGAHAALEARVTVLETEVHRHEWQRQAGSDLAVAYSMRTRP
ncbi:hypothetical protein Tco_0213177 [Tanacetum coccineum]